MSQALLFPQDIEYLLAAYLKSVFANKKSKPNPNQQGFSQRDIEFYAPGAHKLSTLFTEDRADIPRNYLSDPKLRSGYLSYFVPLNIMKTLASLTRLDPTKLGAIKLLDLGSGPGSSALAVSHWAKQHKIALSEIHLVDHSAKALNDGKNLLRQYNSKDTKIVGMTQDLHQLRLKEKYNFIVASHVLNEISTLDKKMQIVSKLIHYNLDDNGILLLIEPALRHPTRELMALRDDLLALGNVEVLAPCLHQNECPMFRGTRGDWCHFYVNWEEPDFIQYLSNIIGNDNRHLNYSYLLLRKSKSLVAKNTNQALVVSNRMVTNGKTEMVLCSRQGRTKLVKLDKHKSKSNMAMDLARRGDILVVDDLSKMDTYEHNRILPLAPKSNLLLI